MHHAAEARLAEFGLALDDEERAESLEPAESDLEQDLIAHQHHDQAHAREAIEEALDEAERAASLEPPAADVLEQAEHAVHDVTAHRLHDIAEAIEDAERSGSLEPDQSSLVESVERSRAEAQARLRAEARAAVDQALRERSTAPSDAELVADLDAVRQASQAQARRDLAAALDRHDAGSYARTPEPELVVQPAETETTPEPQASAPVSPPDAGLANPVPTEPAMSDQDVLAALVAAHDADVALPKQPPSPPAAPRQSEGFGARKHDEFGRAIEPKG